MIYPGVEWIFRDILVCASHCVTLGNSLFNSCNLQSQKMSDACVSTLNQTSASFCHTGGQHRIREQTRRGHTLVTCAPCLSFLSPWDVNYECESTKWFEMPWRRQESFQLIRQHCIEGNATVTICNTNQQFTPCQSFEKPEVKIFGGFVMPNFLCHLEFIPLSFRKPVDKYKWIH